ncbi:MAG: protein-L-isoaspartate(D-aspartate) O-methyltransferase [Candidatus Aminicenantes bacterium]|nr:protein-L-isoaspartate(D-aspartate) O-methyltransferase [Candidatus Aminicenantes bacterium]
MDLKKKQKQMVEIQLKTRGIRDPKVLEAMNKVQRHEFVPNNLNMNAYDDEPLPIGSGQTISQPYVVAYMTEVLKLKGEERVLEIGTGSGYQAAVLAEIAKQVFTVEVSKELAEKAQRILEKLGYHNIEYKIGDGTLGWEEHAPYDAIMVTAAPGKTPEPLKEQLRSGGRMIIPVGHAFQNLILYEKSDGKIKKKKLLPVRFVPLVSRH